jgi:hypothetical protein
MTPEFWVGISTLMITIIGAVWTGTWQLSREMQSVRRDNDVAMDRHETKDQSRHEENLQRFSKINISLAKLNGVGHAEH